ncbi:hypothetical protein F4861DRAFT_520716 [Xylaria intraflava]|nr:hypothetical protein F4861DRAFT_520716 [Xylaria intraflava]
MPLFAYTYFIICISLSLGFPETKVSKCNGTTTSRTACFTLKHRFISATSSTFSLSPPLIYRSYLSAITTSRPPNQRHWEYQSFM